VHGPTRAAGMHTYFNPGIRDLVECFEAADHRSATRDISHTCNRYTSIISKAKDKAIARSEARPAAARAGVSYAVRNACATRSHRAFSVDRHV
jgi:hypothetical protein